MPRLLGPRRGAIAAPPWFSALHAAQLFFAILIVGLTAYALSAHSESQIRPALVLTIITAVLTILPIFPITIPLPTAIIHPLGTLVANLIGSLLWLASLVALASYLRVFSYYRKFERNPRAPGMPHIARAWKCGVAACVFAAVELILFLVTFKLFGYFYHHHRAGTQPHAGLLRSTPRTPKPDPVPLESTSPVIAAGGFNQSQPAPAAAHQQQQGYHHHPPANTISPPDGPLQPTAPVPSTGNHASYSNSINNNNIPSITHTTATPTTSTNPHRSAAGDAFAAASPPPSQRHASPVIPDQGARSGHDRVAGRLPYPVDEDEEMGAVGKGHYQRESDGSGTTAATRRGPAPMVLTAGASER